MSANQDSPKNVDSRHISRLTRDTLALVLAGGRGSRLHELTDWRAKPAVPFGGKFRIIDFPLSNCVNSGIRRIGVLTQYKAHSLLRHVNQGWSRLNPELGEFVEILPASQRTGGEWYKGTADAVFQNIDILRTHQPRYVLILAGDHIYKMDYVQMIAAHEATGAKMTVSCLEVPRAEAAGALGVMTADENGRVTRFQEKPADPAPMSGKPDLCLASMGNYVFDTDFLYEQLCADADDESSENDFGKNIIPRIIQDHLVHAYPFRENPERNPENADKPAYWRDVGTLDAYWDANMDLVSVVPELDIYDETWPIMTYQMQLPPAKFVFDDDDGRRGMAVDSMVSGGCVIPGASLRRTLLFSGVRIEERSEVEDTVVLPGAHIGARVRLKKVIIDRGCIVSDGMVIGEDHAADKDAGFRVTPNGVVLVTPDMLGQQLHFHR